MNRLIAEARKQRAEAAQYRPGSLDHDYRIRAAQRLEALASSSSFAEQEQEQAA